MSATRHRVEPSPRDLEVLKFVRSYSRKHGHAPTRAEIAAKMGFSRPTAEGHLQALQQHKLVVLRTEWRGIFLTARGEAA